MNLNRFFIRMGTVRMMMAAGLAIALLAGCMPKPPKPAKIDDPTLSDLPAVAPTVASVIFQNEHVTALEMNIPDGMKVPEFEGVDRVAFVLADGTLKVTIDGEETTENFQDGEVAWLRGGNKIALENTGNKAIRYLVVYRNHPGLPGVYDCGAPPLTDSMYAEFSPYATIMLENDYVRVVDVELPAGQNLPPTEGGLNRLIYSRNNAVFEYIYYTSEGIQAGKSDWGPGSVEWFPRGSFEVRNGGEIPAKFIVFGFKR